MAKTKMLKGGEKIPKEIEDDHDLPGGQDHLPGMEQMDKIPSIHSLARRTKKASLIQTRAKADCDTLKEKLTEAIRLADVGQIPTYCRSPNLRDHNGKIEKKCTTCREWMPLDNYHTSSRRRCKAQGRCKVCSAEYQRAYQNTDFGRLKHNESERNRKRIMREKLKQQSVPQVEEIKVNG